MLEYYKIYGLRRMRMRSDNWFVRIQKILIPIVLYLTVVIAVEMAGMVFATFIIQMQYGTEVISNYDLFYEYLMQYINNWALAMTEIGRAHV